MRCEPATTIIGKFGSPSAVAEIADVTVHTVLRWRRPKEQGGTGGIIPHWHMTRLLDGAAKRAIDLQPNDFLPTEAERAQ